MDHGWRANVNVYLVGPTGAGKTSVGRSLAERLGRPFLDLDEEIERHCGAAIGLIFEIEGEAGFRRRESDMLAQLVQRSGIVLACGAGAVLDPANRQLLRRHGRVIWLDCAPEVQLQRLARDRARPLLAVTDRQAQLQRMADERTKLYEEIAHARVPTEQRNRPPEMAATILQALAALPETQP